MTTYLVTGATGFLGGQLVERLLADPDADVHVLVRDASRGKLARGPAGGRAASGCTPSWATSCCPTSASTRPPSRR